MDISIIIPSFNTKALLARCLTSIYDSLEGSSLTYEVIVVDNGSVDGSIQVIRSYKKAICIQNKENVGYGRANNQGIERATGKYILLLNSDIRVEDGAIEKLYQFGKSHPESFVGGKLLNEDGTDQSSSGPMMSPVHVFIMLFAKGDTLGLTRSSPSTACSVGWVSGACLLAKKTLFEAVGLFDESIFLYMEEVDLLYRAAQKGYTTYFYPGAVFTHTGAASSGTRRTPVVNIYRGLVYFYKKHYSGPAQAFLSGMLRVKAYIAIVIGRITGNNTLQSIYEEALAMVT
jgi:hypothetical protein